MNLILILILIKFNNSANAAAPPKVRTTIVYSGDKDLRLLKSARSIVNIIVAPVRYRPRPGPVAIEALELLGP